MQTQSNHKKECAEDGLSSTLLEGCYKKAKWLQATPDNNKVQLCQLLLRVWGSQEAASCIEKCGTAGLLADDKAYQMASRNGDVSMEMRMT